MRTIFGTANRYINHGGGIKSLILNKLTDDFGNNKEGIFEVNAKYILPTSKVKLGHRYMVKILDNDICTINRVNKNPRCGIFRRFKDDFHIISGKYQGKKVSELEASEIANYCIWLGQNTYNEITIKNVLTILDKLNNGA